LVFEIHELNPIIIDFVTAWHNTLHL
jgi:hypothetical protein